MSSPTVYVNDYPFGETEVYHARKAHTTHRRVNDRHVRETTADAAREEGLRPCKQCFPTQGGQACPGCGRGFTPDATGERECPNDDCRVVAFRAGGDS